MTRLGQRYDCPSSKIEPGKTEKEIRVDSQTKGRTFVLYTQQLTLVGDIEQFCYP